MANRTIIYSSKDIKSVKLKNTIAYDIETTGLNTHKDIIIGIGLSDGIDSVYFVHKIWNPKEQVLVEKMSKAEIRESLVTHCFGKNLVTWNGSFDLRFTKRYLGLDFVDFLWSDAMLAKHTTDEDFPFGMKECAVKEFGPHVIGERDSMLDSIVANGGSSKEYYKADVEKIAEYCMKDCELTLRLNQLYLQRAASENLVDFFLKTEVMPLYKHVTIPMEYKGIPIDVEKIKQVREEVSVEISKLETQLLEAVAPYTQGFEDTFFSENYPVSTKGKFAQALIEELGIELPKTATGKYSTAKKLIEELPESLFKNFMLGKERLPSALIRAVRIRAHGSIPTINLHSKDDLKMIFFSSLNERPISFTPTGEPKVDDEFLRSIASKYEFVQLLRDYNKLSKLKSTYMDRFLEEQIDGIYYPSFQQHRTVSGRYGSDLQQLPRLKEEGTLSPIVLKYTNMIRSFFIAGEGHSFADADYNQLEVVVFADDAGDEALLDIIRKGNDFYSTTAIDIFNLKDKYSADKKSEVYLGKLQKPIRDQSKVYSLGIRYGMKSYKLSKTLNISEQEASKIIKNYFDSYPNLKNRMDGLISEALTNGKVRSKAGRVRHLPELPKLRAKYGTLLDDGLKLWEKYGDNPTLYKQVKLEKRKYGNLVNNALNFPIQSMASSIVNQAAIAISKKFKEQNIPAYICLNVHDQLVSRFKTGYEDAVKRIMQDCMENTIKLKAPLTAKPEVGYTLLETH
ncbi:MAG: hypothetical protein FMNOHCHN_03764 [Ignavibacteriaceae bacterium]|nr:hypothetical protein [Ignavibacteriaceae bacterium]